MSTSHQIHCLQKKESKKEYVLPQLEQFLVRNEIDPLFFEWGCEKG